MHPLDIAVILVGVAAGVERDVVLPVTCAAVVFPVLVQGETAGRRVRAVARASDTGGARAGRA